jgi:dipeptidyl-peptidase-3
MPSTSPTSLPTAAAPANRAYLVERVGEAAVVQLYADGFRDLPLREKTLIWHLGQAAIAGRDIFYDQRYVHNLEMRDVLEAIVGQERREAQEGQRQDGALAAIERYTKLFWINTGPYNNLTARKFVLECTPAAFRDVVHAAARRGAAFPLRNGETLDAMLDRLEPLFFDPDVDPTVTSKTPPPGQDMLTASANNLYVDVTSTDLLGFVEEYGLNSRLVKRDGRLVEEVYRVGETYGAQIGAIVRHLDAAIPYATEAMAAALRALITFYTTGRRADREAYDIAWVEDKASPVDTINGFIEVYLDARSIKGAWEALVFYVNRDKTHQIQAIAANAQWFEDHTPWDARYRKAGAKGITANAIDVVIETGDSGPMTPVGINLPNDQAIREQHGSKSVSLSNVIEAYDKSTMPELRSEFSWSDEETVRATKWSAFAAELTTNMHEVIGHGSGKVSARLTVSPPEALKEQYSAIEESRADLVALYFLPEAKLVDIGLLAEEDHHDIVLAEYEAYTRNALVQLRRVRHGSQIEEDHMRNRQLIVQWLMANTTAIEVRQRDGKTYYVMVDAEAFRHGVGRLLSEVMRIKAEGDYDAARALVERYGVHFDPLLRDEVMARVERLNLPSYTGFVMPRLTAIRDDAGAITDVEISYPLDLATQMFEYSAATRHLR